MTARRIEWACQQCGTPNETSYEEIGRGPLRCARCGGAWDLEPEEGHVVEGRVERCRFCGGGVLYVQKDFNRTLGLLIVVAGAGVALFLGWAVHPFLFGAVLLVFALLDALLYGLLPLVDVCYRCQTVWRGFEPVPDREGYDLDTAEWNERQFTLEVRHRLSEGRARVAGEDAPSPRDGRIV